MKNILIFVILIGLICSCSKEQLTTIENPSEEIIDESTLKLQEGFVDRKVNTNIKAVLASENCILMSTSTEENVQLIKYKVSAKSNEWQAETWYKERAGTGNYHYQYDDIILFRQGHHDFAINLENGSLIYDEEREGCPDSRLAGIDYNYFTRGEIIDEATQLKKEIILIGDMRESDTPEILVSPPYDSIGFNGSLGRIMNLDVFENEAGEEMLAIRYFDYGPNSSQNLFAVYNIAEKNWIVENAPLEHHTLGTQTIIANDLIYYGSNSHLSCLDTKTGELQWVTEAFTLAPYYLLAFSNDIFLKNHNGMVQRRESNTGDLIWESFIGDINRFIIVHNKLFIIGDNFTILNIETGETLASFSSPYIDYETTNYFRNVSDLMGYYNVETKRSNIFLNINEHLIHYEIE